MKKISLILIISFSLVFTACSRNNSSVLPQSKSNASSDSEISIETEAATDSKKNDNSDSTTESNNANPYYDLDFSFTSEDIFGNPITHDIYKNADLTLLNIFATWCPPCVEEMPYLSSLNTEFKDQSFQVIGFCTDLRNAETKELDNEAIDTAKDLFSGVNSTYPYIIPDETFLGGILFVQYFPTTVFLDKNGKMLGEPVVGANSYEGWKEEITKRLEALNR